LEGSRAKREEERGLAVWFLRRGGC
jgi:hypothetical protein